MREAVQIMILGLALVTSLATPTALADEDDCTEVHYAVTQSLSGTVSTCQGIPSLPDVDQPVLPDLPGGSHVPLQGDDCWFGKGVIIEHESGQELVWFCATASSGPPGDPGLSSWVPSTGQEDCPSGSFGGVMQIGDNRVGGCLYVEGQLPDGSSGGIIVDTSACSIEGAGEGSDPAILFLGGGIAFCFVPIVELGGDLPEIGQPIGIDTEPCHPEAQDPAVSVFGQEVVRVCYAAGVEPIGALGP